MIGVYLKALSLIFLAEMGDKTQLLAMAFATKYKVRHIVLGIGLGAFLNHGLAILLGSFLQRIIPFEVIYLVAGLAFIIFGLLSLEIEDDGVETPEAKFGPILTVGMAFFIGELGDKTQLTALTLSTSSTYPFAILMGTVTGMVLTGLLAIWVGRKLGNKIPELQLKFGAAAVFLFFGIEKFIASKYFVAYTGYFMMVIALCFVIFAYRARRMILTNRAIQSQYSITAEKLRKHFLVLQKGVNQLCLGPSVCEHCDGTSCLIGSLKSLIQRALDNDYDETIIDQFHVEELLIKKYNQDQIKALLAYIENEIMDDVALSNNAFIIRVKSLLQKAQEE
jgi:putative Ca2+/H+ antiporter (TMEM165/GDT1 family)